jgi:hypothetical protein
MKRVSPFRTGAISLFASFAILLCSSGLGLAQDIATKGGISGRVTDSAGAAIVNAKIIITGQTGDRTVTSNSDGEFDLQNLIPGSYKVKVEQSGFKTLTVPGVEVYVGKTSALKLTLEAGNISEVVEVTAGAASVDTTSTAIGSNLNDQLYNNLPLQRNVQSLFYLAPGTTDSLSGGRANPSISGGSALDNLYVADGVNITDSAFGGLGVFSRSYGTIGVGINTTFIKEVQVKTGGFEPQFGQSQGGIVNIITKSGTNEYHGAITGFFQPRAFEAARRQPDDFPRTNKFGKRLNDEGYDASFELGGPVPGGDKLFFFGSFNPSVQRAIVRGADGSGLGATFGETHRRLFTKNYSLKLDYAVTQNHQLNFSIFGDPTTTNVAAFRTLNIDNTTSNSKLDLGTRNIAVRYTGALSSTWTVSASFGQGHNSFNELGFANEYNIVDRTNTARGNFNAVGIGFFEPTEGTTYRTTVDTQKQVSLLGSHTFAVGYNYQRGFYSGLRERSGAKYNIPLTNSAGDPLSSLVGARSAALAAGQPTNAAFSLRPAPNDPDDPDDDCTLCPLLTVNGTDVPVFLRQDRGEFGTPSFDTSSKYHSAYVQDTWRLNRFITGLFGYRWEQERLIGSPGSNGARIDYIFTGNWSPRFGVTVDPFGKGKTKFYYNYGRFHEFIPLDLAERSLSSEKDFTLAAFAPDFTVDAAGNRRVKLNQFNTVTPVLDTAHFISGATGGINAFLPTVSAQDPSSPILPGTKLGYTNEHLIGFEQQLPGNFVVSVRYIDRKIGRIVEDAAVVSPEGASFFGQTYFIGNITSKIDAAVNPQATKLPANFAPVFIRVDNPDDPDDRSLDRISNLPSGSPGCIRGLYNPEVTNNAGDVVGQICYAPLGKNGQPAGNPGGDGVADGFPDPVRNYRAVEIEINKRFSKGWQLLSNWRIAKLDGNFEGHFRNDNGQTDPAISSLFDFTAGEFNLLGDQFQVGPLNTDRRHIINIYGSYAFGESNFGKFARGLNLGLGIRLESGVPLSEYLAHPVYANAGEVPLGGRGKLGRSPFYGRLDLHADYPFKITERMKMTFVGDFFNVTNNQEVRLIDQFRESTLGQQNPDFGKPSGNAGQLNPVFHVPFNMRLGLKFEF